MSYYLMLIVSKIVCILPWNLCNFIGDKIVRFAWIFFPRRRKILARDNVKRCLQLNDEQADKIAKDSVIRLGAVLFEVLRIPVLKHQMKNYVKVENLHYLLDYQNSGTNAGAILITGHSDNWELMGGALNQYGIPVVGVAKKQRSNGVDRFITEYRKMLGVHVTYKTDVREMFDMLQQGWFIGLIMDQDPSRKDGVVVNFFNQPTNTPVGPASMARFKNVPIFPTFLHKNPDGTHTLTVHKPIYVEKTKDKREDIRRTTQQLNDLIESHIRKYPAEWFWIHDRWKSMREEF